MRPLSLLLLTAALAGCGGSTPLVAEYSPDRRFTLSTGDWLKNGSLKPTESTAGRIDNLESGRIVDIIAGGHDILRFTRKDDEVQLSAWVEVDADGRLVSAWMWAREWTSETKWFVGSAGTGTSRVDERDDDTLEGSVDLTFQGRGESPRSGISGPYVFRLKGDFTVKAPGAR
ncbi:MAG: hypothetical protein AAB074_10230 [Planctomycetota bacterium]